MSFGAGAAAGFGVHVGDDDARHVASHRLQSPNPYNPRVDHLSCQKNWEISTLSRQTNIAASNSPERGTAD